MWCKKLTMQDARKDCNPWSRTLGSRQFGNSWCMTWTQMCGLTVVFEGSDSLAELQRVQRLLHWRCGCLRGCRIIKSSLFNLHQLWNKNDRYCSCRLFHVASSLILESLRNSVFRNGRNNFASPRVWLLVFTTKKFLIHKRVKKQALQYLCNSISLLTNKKVKVFNGLSYSTSKKNSETRGSTTTHP